MGSVGRPKGPSALLEKRRFYAMILSDNGWSPQKISKNLDISINSVYLWRSRYTKNGFHGVASTQITGRPTLLDRKTREQFFDETVDQIRNNDESKSTYITAKMMHALLQEHFKGIKCNQWTVTRWLKEAGWTRINGIGFIPPK